MSYQNLPLSTNVILYAVSLTLEAEITNEVTGDTVLLDMSFHYADLDELLDDAAFDMELDSREGLSLIDVTASVDDENVQRELVNHIHWHEILTKDRGFNYLDELLELSGIDLIITLWYLKENHTDEIEYGIGAVDEHRFFLTEKDMLADWFEFEQVRGTEVSEWISNNWNLLDKEEILSVYYGGRDCVDFIGWIVPNN